MAEDCVRSLKAYSWPGNVRELRNVTEAQLSCAGRRFFHPVIYRSIWPIKLGQEPLQISRLGLGSR